MEWREREKQHLFDVIFRIRSTRSLSSFPTMATRLSASKQRQSSTQVAGDLLKQENEKEFAARSCSLLQALEAKKIANGQQTLASLKMFSPTRSGAS